MSKYLSKILFVLIVIFLSIVWFLWYQLGRDLYAETPVVVSQPNPPSAPPTSPSPTATPSVKTTVSVPESDPPVHCPISDACGGGTIPLKQSECSQVVCCQIGDKWELKENNQVCDEAQGEVSGGYNPTYQYSPPPTLPAFPTHSPSYSPIPFPSIEPYPDWLARKEECVSKLEIEKMDDLAECSVLYGATSMEEVCRKNVSERFDVLFSACPN